MRLLGTKGAKAGRQLSHRVTQFLRLGQVQRKDTPRHRERTRAQTIDTRSQKLHWWIGTVTATTREVQLQVSIHIRTRKPNEVRPQLTMFLRVDGLRNLQIHGRPESKIHQCRRGNLLNLVQRMELAKHRAISAEQRQWVGRFPFLLRENRLRQCCDHPRDLLLFSTLLVIQETTRVPFEGMYCPLLDTRVLPSVATHCWHLNQDGLR